VKDDRKANEDTRPNWQTVAMLSTVMVALVGFLCKDIYTRLIDSVSQNREDIHRLEIYIEGLKHK
jgi:hypothetical protein